MAYSAIALIHLCQALAAGRHQASRFRFSRLSISEIKIFPCSISPVLPAATCPIPFIPGWAYLLQLGSARKHLFLSLSLSSVAVCQNYAHTAAPQAQLQTATAVRLPARQQRQREPRLFINFWFNRITPYLPNNPNDTPLRIGCNAHNHFSDLFHEEVEKEC